MKKSYGKQHISDAHWIKWYNGFFDNTCAWDTKKRVLYYNLDLDYESWEIDEDGEPIDLMRAYHLEDD
jgi:hypothetical protein